MSLIRTLDSFWLKCKYKCQFYSSGKTTMGSREGQTRTWEHFVISSSENLTEKWKEKMEGDRRRRWRASKRAVERTQCSLTARVRLTDIMSSSHTLKTSPGDWFGRERWTDTKRKIEVQGKEQKFLQWSKNIKPAKKTDNSSLLSLFYWDEHMAPLTRTLYYPLPKCQCHNNDFQTWLYSQSILALICHPLPTSF